MNCKNCGLTLVERSDYCHACGAKVIRNRLTFRNLFEHISETFFNYDNKLLRTFLDLFKKPDEVIGGYISGIRRRYVNPISYLGIALTLSGVTFFIMKKVNFQMDFDVFNQGIDENVKGKIANFSSEFSSFIFLSYIPMFVISSWLILKQQNYNFTERIVAFTYAMAQFSLSSFIPSILILLFIPSLYLTFSFIFLFLLGVFITWVLYRLSKLRGIEFIAQLMIFFCILGIIYMIYSVGLFAFGLLSGDYSLQDFVPKR